MSATNFPLKKKFPHIYKFIYYLYKLACKSQLKKKIMILKLPPIYFKLPFKFLLFLKH